MRPRRSLIALAAALIGTAACAQVPGLGASVIGFAASVVYSAWNTSDAGSGFSFSNANRTWSNSTQNRLVRSSTSKSSGKWYFEVTAINVGANMSIGIATSAAALGNYLGGDQYGYGYTATTGIQHNGPGGGSASGYTTNDVISIAVDLVGNCFYLAKNGTWQNSGNPGAGTGCYTITAGTYFAASSTWNNAGTSQATLNVGNAAFSYSIPSGYSAWR